MKLRRSEGQKTLQQTTCLIRRIPTKILQKKKEINDAFPKEYLYNIQVVKEKEPPCFVDFANYLVARVISKWSKYQQKKFFSYLKYYIWEDTYLFRVCSYQIVQRCICRVKGLNILKHCHARPTRRHYSVSQTIIKILDAGFY